MNCTNCGSSLRPTAKLCIQCGTAVGSTKPPAEIKSEKIDSDLQRPELTQVTKAENSDTINSTIHTPEKVEATVVRTAVVGAPAVVMVSTAEGSPAAYAFALAHTKIW